jgi:hypothetical protein
MYFEIIGEIENIETIAIGGRIKRYYATSQKIWLRQLAET